MMEQHWFTCEAIWSVKRITDEATKITHMETMFRDRSLMWYMKYKAIVLMGQTRYLMKIKRDLLKEFNPNSKSQCITEIKRLSKKGETVWDYEQWLKILLDRLTFQI
jgi:hypothetical protein